MTDRSWFFLQNLNKSEVQLLYSAIELSGLPDCNVTDGCSVLIDYISKITGTNSYDSLLYWGNQDNYCIAIHQLEKKYISSIYKFINFSQQQPQFDVVRTAFNILDIYGLSWEKEILDEIILSCSTPKERLFVFGRNIYYGCQHVQNKEVVWKGQRIPKLFLKLLNFSFVRSLAKTYLQNKLIPLVCALIIIRNERIYRFEDCDSCLNYICAYLDNTEGVNKNDVIRDLLYECDRNNAVSKIKMEITNEFKSSITNMLTQRLADDGIIKSINWNYTIQNTIISSGIITKRRHTFMHAISDDIAAVIKKLNRDIHVNSELKVTKGEEIIALNTYFQKWIEDIKTIPLDDNLPESILSANIRHMVYMGEELYNKVSPFFHILIEQYAYLFPGYQDGNNIAYRRLKDFVETEDKLKKQISDFSSIKTYGKIEDTSTAYIIELIKVSLEDITSFVEYYQDVDYCNSLIKLNVNDFQNYVLDNFKSNLKEKAFFKRENIKNKIKVRIAGKNDKIAICLSNNGEPFTGDTKRVFEEHYTFGENRGTGQGMYDAIQYMNYIGGDIQMEAIQYMEYPVRFVIILPLSRLYENNKNSMG